MRIFHSAFSSKRSLKFSIYGFIGIQYLLACASSVPKKNLNIAPPDAQHVANKNKSSAQVDEMLDQLPEDARGSDGEISIPVDPSVLQSSEKKLTPLEQRRREVNARRTDQEIIGATRSRDDALGKEMNDIDKKLKVTNDDNNDQLPSFTLGSQKIKDLYKMREYDEALIEANELLRYYPKSAALLSMKGSLHQRLGQIDVALSSYKRAYEYEPSRRLLAQIEHLQRLIAERESLRRTREGIVTPGGVQEMKEIPPKVQKGEN